jgi:acyl transferase domain-containing protein
MRFGPIDGTVPVAESGTNTGIFAGTTNSGYAQEASKFHIEIEGSSATDGEQRPMSLNRRFQSVRSVHVYSENSSCGSDRLTGCSAKSLSGTNTGIFAGTTNSGYAQEASKFHIETSSIAFHTCIIKSLC